MSKLTPQEILQEVFEIGCALINANPGKGAYTSLREYLEIMDRSSTDACGLWGQMLYDYYDGDIRERGFLSLILSDAAANGIEI